MGKSQQTFHKKEIERKKLQTRKEKEQRRQEQKANAKEGKSLEDMLAYVDENGNITSTPPDPTKRRQVNESEIELGSRNRGGATPRGVQQGVVNFFNTSKGFGFIVGEQAGDRIFFHTSETDFAVKEGDRVGFEVQYGPKGATAVNVHKVS